MIIKDKIYGTFEITSPIIIELIKSKPIQRLKNIAQYGVPDEFYHLRHRANRFDHSFGVMLLLNILRASEEEQIAGLIHDVSHTAFSHVVDHLFGDDINEDYQDKQHKSFVKNSEIFTILKKYDYNPEIITDYKRYRLLEQDIPNLCADRLDYAFRELPLEITHRCLKGLTVLRNKIIFQTEENAFLFATHFLRKHLKHWGGYEAVSRYKIFAAVLKYALENNLIKITDFNKDDNYIVDKLKISPHQFIKKRLWILRKKSLMNLAKSKKKYHKKFRYVDSEFIKNGRLTRLSRVNGKFKHILEKAEKENSLGVRIAIIK